MVGSVKILLIVLVSTLFYSNICSQTSTSKSTVSNMTMNSTSTSMTNFTETTVKNSTSTSMINSTLITENTTNISSTTMGIYYSDVHSSIISCSLLSKAVINLVCTNSTNDDGCEHVDNNSMALLKGFQTNVSIAFLIVLNVGFLHSFNK